MKKGQTSGDIISFLILFFFSLFLLVITILFVLPYYTNGNTDYTVEKAFSERLDTSFLSGYLHHSEQTELWVMIVEAYLKKDYGDFSRATDTLLKDVYGKETGWRLYIDNKKAAESCHDGCEGEQLDYATTLPLPYDPTVRLLQIHLQVYP